MYSMHVFACMHSTGCLQCGGSDEAAPMVPYFLLRGWGWTGAMGDACWRSGAGVQPVQRMAGRSFKGLFFSFNLVCGRVSEHVCHALHHI